MSFWFPRMGILVASGVMVAIRGPNGAESGPRRRKSTPRNWAVYGRSAQNQGCRVKERCAGLSRSH